MSFRKTTRRRAVVLLGLSAACFHPSLFAESGRDFAGWYRVSNLQSLGSGVTFQFSLKLFNYSGVDVSDAKVTFSAHVDQSNATALDYRGSFASVSVRYRKSVDLKGTFSVPESEYQQWQRGATPSLVISYLNTTGDTVQSSIELSAKR